MGKTKIEYLSSVWNIFTGCNNWQNGICAVGAHCWARAMCKRFPKAFGGDFSPRFHPERLLEPLKLRHPGARIGVSFLGDLFGDWVDPHQDVNVQIPSSGFVDNDELIGWVFNAMTACPQHQFFFLTKCPQNYQKWGQFPDNAWLGASAWDRESARAAVSHLMDASALHTWLSFEPLYGPVIIQPFDELLFDTLDIGWIVIGAQSAPKKLPKREWVKDIIVAADKRGIPVWLKNNLMLPGEDYWGGSPFYKRDKGRMILRQELPK